MPVGDLPPTRAGRLVAWGNALVGGWTSLDEAAERVVGGDTAHRVDGLPSGDDVSLTVAMGRLIVAGAVGFRLALPVPGDVSGLPGPLDFNVEALAAGEAVLFDGLTGGLVPTVTRHHSDQARHRSAVELVRWRWLGAQPTPPRGLSLADADRALATAVREATVALADLDVGGMDPATAATLSGLRVRARLGDELAPGYSDRAREVLRRAHWLIAVVTLAGKGTGAAVSAAEIGARRERLAAVGRTARLAIVAAHNSPNEGAPSRGPLPR